MSNTQGRKSIKEVELLLQCATTERNAARVRRIQNLLSNDIDWHEFVKLAAFHRVEPLVYQSLEATYPDAIPSAVRDDLRMSFHSTAANNLLSVNELQRVTELLNDVGIRSVGFKGPVLAEVAYKNLGLRPCTDIDILVDRRDFARASSLLTHDRYLEYEKSGPGSLQKALHLFVSRQAVFVDGVMLGIDLHTSVLPPGYAYSPTFQTLLERSEVVDVANTAVRTVSNEDLLLILCHHGAKNRWELIKYLCDVAELIRARPELDWEAVLREAHASQSERILYLGLHLAKTLLEAPLPPEIQQKVASDGAIEQLGSEIEASLRLSHFASMGLRKRIHFFLMIQDTLVNKVRYGIYTILRRFIFTDSHASRAH